MSASRPSTNGIPHRRLECELLEARCVLDAHTWTALPHTESAVGLLADTHLTVTPSTEEPTPTQWQGRATFPILVTALLVTLCGQVELFGGRKTSDSWTTPLL